MPQNLRALAIAVSAGHFCMWCACHNMLISCLPPGPNGTSCAACTASPAHANALEHALRSLLQALRQASRLECLSLFTEGPGSEELALLCSMPALRRLWVGISATGDKAFRQAVLRRLGEALPQLQVLKDGLLEWMDQELLEACTAVA